MGASVAEGVVVIVGGTSGLGRRLAEKYTAKGRPVVITGRDAARVEAVAGEMPEGVRGVALELCEPHEIAARLDGIAAVDRVVLAAIDRDSNTVRDYDAERALKLATLKLVGYTEVLHCLHPAMHDETAVLMFGGLAKDRPYPGSTTVTAVNGAVTSMVRTFAVELAPVRVNALHPGIVGDSPMWKDAGEMLANVKARTPTGRLITMDDVTDAAIFLLENRAMNGVNLAVDGGWMML
jgi:NAD(P)-dependent dehydrogenase (short-subunit alcohol dehydrogenase family)